MLERAEPELRAAVAAILAQESTQETSDTRREGNAFLDRPAWEGRQSLLETKTLIGVGQQLGPYRIDQKIGQGGMGEVFRATDTRLHRTVAIKTSLVHFTERFEREARVVAALNHPHIAALYDVGASPSGFGYLVLEYVEGRTLADLIAKGRVEPQEARRIALEIAEAIEAAHEKGIVHRDLKPANIKLGEGGTVKVLDFGLAKATGEVQPTGSDDITKKGAIFGTPAYMSPEQALGGTADRRSDIWSYGALVGEMVSGRRLFTGASTSDVLASVVRGEPDLTGVPDEWVPLIRRCLTKDVRRRLQSIGEARILLEDGLRVPAPVGRRPSMLRWMLLAAALVATGLFGLLRFTAPSVQPALVRFGVPIPGGVAQSAIPALSPDGSSIAISAIEGGRFRLRVRPMDSLETRLLPGADGAQFPFWSPDSKRIGFFADGKLKTILAAGGEPVTLAEVEPLILGATWGTRGVIVFCQARELYKVNEKGGVPEHLYEPDSGIHFDPEFLPDGNHVLWMKYPSDGIFLGSLDGKPPVRILPDLSRTVYSPDGYLLFVRQGRLTAQRFDLKTLALTGEALPVTGESVVNGRVLSAARGGAVAYVEKSQEQLAWVDRTGSIKEKVGPPQDLAAFRLSMDESKIAFQESTTGVAVFDRRRGTREPLTSEAKNSFVPVFSPDGTRVAFSSSRTGRFNPYITDGPNREKLVVDMQLAGGFPTDWSPDGKNLLYWGNGDLWIVPVDGREKPYTLAKTRFDERAGSFSPDGKWVAYSSNESLRYEVYLTPFPVGDGKRYTVSSQGGASPAWRRDGKELYFVAGDGRLTAVPVTIRGSDVQFGRAESLFPVDSDQWNRVYEPSRDGQRFLIAMPAAPGGAAFTVMLNWTQALGK